MIQDCKTGIKINEKKVTFRILKDEEWPTLYQRSIKSLKELCLLLLFCINSKKILFFLLSLVGLVILGLCFNPLTTKTFLAYTCFESNDKSIHVESGFNQNSYQSAFEVFKKKDEGTVNLIESKAKTHNGMVLLKPSYRSVISLYDRNSKKALVSRVTKEVRPYRRNETAINDYVDWFKFLLRQAYTILMTEMMKRLALSLLTRAVVLIQFYLS